MKKNIITLLLYTTCLSASSTWAVSDSAKINVSGKIVSNTCIIDDKLSDLSPVLDTISDRDLQGVGKTQGQKKIAIVLKDCGKDTTGVSIKASGDADKESSSAFINTATTSAATGVGLYFYETDLSTLFKPDGSVTEEATLKPGDNTLTYQAAYVATKESPGAGDFSAVVNLTLNYK
ncbi:fimbrial protein [Pantoea anthophila]|uniref:fimbrial protein n=1 Tax=Pantoea anthophila TaxID=470931 RepID=UPI000907EA74|nr:fimbrial protein [Pantoea anthophila]